MARSILSRVFSRLLPRSPGVRAADNAFYAALANRARRSPAFLGWDLWSEPHVINWANPTWIPNPEFCFCPHTIRRFRGWLQAKYGSLEKLNEAWYRRFSNWDQVEPGRMSTILSYTDYIDWKTFIADKLGEDLHDRYQAVKQVAPSTIVTSHAAGVGLFSSPHHWEGQADDWTMAGKVDFYGTSFYPKHSAFVDRDAPWRAALLRLHAIVWLRRGPAGLLGGRVAERLRHDRSECQSNRDAIGSQRVDVDGAVARGQGHQLLRLVSDELGVRVGRVRPQRARWLRHGTREACRLDCQGRRQASIALPRRQASARRRRRDLQPARAFCRRSPARRSLRRAAGRGDRHRTRLAARHPSRPAGPQRADRLRAHRPPFGRHAPPVQAGVLPLPADAARSGRAGADRLRQRRGRAGRRGAAWLEQRARVRVGSHPGAWVVAGDGRPRERDRDLAQGRHDDPLDELRCAGPRQRPVAARPLVQGDTRTGVIAGPCGRRVRRRVSRRR